MFVRVRTADGRYFWSMAYAVLRFDWKSCYVVQDPADRAFVLTLPEDDRDPQDERSVKLIQPDGSGFQEYRESALLQYKEDCRNRGMEPRSLTSMWGYPDVCENHEFLADLLAHGRVPEGKYPIAPRDLPDRDRWNYVLTQSDADAFLRLFAGFHDSTLERAAYAEDYDGRRQLDMTFDNRDWFGVAELCFEGVQSMKIVPSLPDDRYLYDGTLIVEDGSVFWADRYMEKADESFDGSYVRALCLKWRKVE